MKKQKRNHLFLIFFVVFCLSLLLFNQAFAIEEEEEERPPRAIGVYPQYPGVIVAKGEEVNMDITVANNGKSDEDVLVKLTSIPEGWKARIKTYSYDVTGVHVPSGESKDLTFVAEQEKKKVKAGKYIFKILGMTKDGKLKFNNDITVIVKEKKKKEKEDIVITTSYPVLQGPSDAEFEFSMEVENKMDKDMVFNLIAQGPSDWEINFKPAYENKYISSVRLKSKLSKSVAVAVKPPKDAKAGKYPITVTVSAGEHKAKAKLMVVLTGTYKLDVGTTSGLLSLNAQKGKEATLSLYVKNSGTATNHDISFLSFKPENWKVKFKPEKIAALKPGDIKQVEVSIKPSEDALVGDYSVVLNVKGEKSSDEVEMRVTVKTSPIWGWIGIGIIILVIAVLFVLFIYLGRR